MPAKDHAAWDLLPVLPKGPGGRSPLDAARRRTHQYEQAAEGSAEARAGLAAEHELRMRAWALRGPFFGRGLTIAFMALPAAVALLGLAAVLAKAGSRPRWQEAEVMLWSLAPAVIFLIIATRIRLIIQPRRRLGARRCPDCGYDLRGAPPGIDPTATRAAGTADPDVGPRHCPECGAFWPLVPPAPISGA